jgi:6-pyruvoyltetrahydropterin/6-carboxytetrahydropterin synthase
MDPKDDTARRKTLLTLIELAGGSTPSACWDDTRAEDLLRSQSTPEEVRELGMSEEMIDRVFGGWEAGSGEWETKKTGIPHSPSSTGVGRGSESLGSESPESVRPSTISHPQPHSPYSTGVGGRGSENLGTKSPESERPAALSHSPLPTPHSPSFTVRVSARFEAAHFLREYRGISEPLHGHSYKVEADLAARAGGVDSDAIAVDFVSARRKLEALAKTLDYGCINDIPPFDRINPSAENIAEWFARELGATVAEEDAVVRAVTIWEGPVNSVTFRP